MEEMKFFGFGIVDKNGEPFQDCVTHIPEILRKEYDAAYPMSAPFRTVELFYKDEQP